STASLKASATVNVVSSAQAITLSGLNSPVIAGTPQNVVVTVVDSFGNPIPDYTGTIHFTSSDPQAVLPADYTFTAADRGKHSFTLTLNTAGSQSITIVDLNNTNLRGSMNGITVTQAQASEAVRLQIAGPTNAVAGQVANYTITALDAQGRVATGYRGTIFWI